MTAQEVEKKPDTAPEFRGPIVRYPKVVIFGDSIVQYSTRPGGFASLFAEKYERKADVVVRGFSGYNSNHYTVIAESVVAGLLPGDLEAIVLFIGTNDATFKTSFQYVDLKYTLANAKLLFEILQRYTKRVIVVPPAYCEDSLRDDRCDADFERYSEAILKLARTYAAKDGGSSPIHVIDSRKVLANKHRKSQNGKQPNYDPDALLDDGLHFTPFGYQKMFEAIANDLEDLEKNWLQTLAPLESFMHLNVIDQEALLRGYLVEAEPWAQQ